MTVATKLGLRGPHTLRDLLPVMGRPLALGALGVLIAQTYEYAQYLHSFKNGVSSFIIVFSIQFALYLAGCYVVLRPPGTKTATLKPVATFITVAIIVLFAAQFRVYLIDEPPYLSSDVYRYIWDGRVQASGINPYRYIPAEPELEHLRDAEIYGYINRRDFAHTIYPPVAQAIFLGVYLASPSSITAFKAAMSLFDAVAMIAIMLALARAKVDVTRVILFAWHPLIIWEGAHSGHIESASIAFLALALLAWAYNKPGLTGIALALATLVKLYPAMLLPVFATPRDSEPSAAGSIASRIYERISLRMLIAFCAAIAITYLPYMSVGAGVMGYLPGYLKEEGFVDAGQRYFLLGLLRQVLPLPTPAYTVVAALALAGLGAWLFFRRRRTVIDVARASAALIALFTILSSPRYSWYIAWLVPFVCFAPRAEWLYLTGASVFLYLLWLTADFPNIPLWLGAAIYLPAVALLLWGQMRRGYGTR